MSDAILTKEEVQTMSDDGHRTGQVEGTGYRMPMSTIYLGKIIPSHEALREQRDLRLQKQREAEGLLHEVRQERDQMTERIMRFEAEVYRLTQERDEAREWVGRLTAETRVLTCVYCGHAYPPGSPTHGTYVLTDHIKVCEKHPMRAVEAELAEERLARRSAERRLGELISRHRACRHQGCNGGPCLLEP